MVFDNRVIGFDSYSAAVGIPDYLSVLLYHPKIRYAHIYSICLSFTHYLEVSFYRLKNGNYIYHPNQPNRLCLL